MKQEYEKQITKEYSKIKNKNIFMKIGEIIKSSLYKSNKPDSTPSSSRIFGYVMMSVIFMAGMSAIGIEIVNAIIVWNEPGPGTYTIPTEHIVIIGMWLTHQLTLLGLYKRSDKGNGHDDVQALIAKTDDKKEETNNEES